MAKKCKATGKGPLFGQSVSHAHNTRKRKFLPNIHVRRVWIASKNAWIRLPLSAKAIRSIDTGLIDPETLL